jgi:hypothetical protein
VTAGPVQRSDAGVLEVGTLHVYIELEDMGVRLAWAGHSGELLRAHVGCVEGAVAMLAPRIAGDAAGVHVETIIESELAELDAAIDDLLAGAGE